MIPGGILPQVPLMVVDVDNDPISKASDFLEVDTTDITST